MMDKEKLHDYFEVTKDKHMVVKPGKYVEVHIPTDYFDTNISQLIGDCVTTFGFFDILLWDEYQDSPKESDAKKVHMRLPTIVTTKPMRISQDTKRGLMILEYHENDQLITSTMIAKSGKVVYKYFDLLLRGKVPDDIPYDKLVSYLEECAQINGVNMKVNSVFLDIIAMVVSRDPNNLTRQFREVLKDNKRTSMKSRKLVNMDVIPSLTSQFSAIAGSNPKYGITSTIGAIRSGDMKVEEESDIEKAIK